jgi:hypothetical protein
MLSGKTVPEEDQHPAALHLRPLAALRCALLLHDGVVKSPYPDRFSGTNTINKRETP